MKDSFSEKFEKARYGAFLEELGQLIDRLRVESGCGKKPMKASIHCGYKMLQGVWMAGW
ncbi:MAG: hypothetical protein ACI4OZ_05995 [Akkermansia sp.]